MKHKSVIASIFLLTAVNTAFLWERLPSLWDLGIFIALMFIWVVLGFVLLLKIGGILIDRFKNKRQIVSSSVIGIVLLLTFLYPNGIVRPENFEDPPVMIAQREGVANCSTTIVLKDDLRFKETSACFGVDRSEGSYQINGDTVKLQFDNESNFGSTETFAIIELNPDTSKSWIGSLIYYRNYGDTIPLTLNLTKLQKEKIKSMKAQ